MILKRGWVLLGLLGTGCAELAPVEEWGAECRATVDPARRLELVRRIMDTGDERSIPVLIDALASVKERGKGPDRVYGAGAVLPNQTAPPEFWGLYIITQQDFDLDVDRWRAWYEAHRGKLVWEGGPRRFFVKP